jgi:hypothetical protein
MFSNEGFQAGYDPELIRLTKLNMNEFFEKARAQNILEKKL